MVEWAICSRHGECMRRGCPMSSSSWLDCLQWSTILKQNQQRKPPTWTQAVPRSQPTTLQQQSTTLQKLAEQQMLPSSLRQGDRHCILCAPLHIIGSQTPQDSWLRSCLQLAGRIARRAVEVSSKPVLVAG